MNVTYGKKQAMTFIGYHTGIRPEEAYRKCPEFWDVEYAAKYARLWQTMKPENDVEKAIPENGMGMYAILRGFRRQFYILDRGTVSGRRGFGGSGALQLPREQVGGVYGQRADAGFSANAEYGGMAGAVPE